MSYISLTALLDSVKFLVMLLKVDIQVFWPCCSQKCPVDEQSKKRAVDDSNDSDDQSGPEKKRGATHETILAVSCRQTSDIRRSKSKNLIASRLVL